MNAAERMTLAAWAAAIRAKPAERRGQADAAVVAAQEQLDGCERLLADLEGAPFTVDLAGPGDVVSIDRHLWRDFHERATELLAEPEPKEPRHDP